jgi:hypothetical protein
MTPAASYGNGGIAGMNTALSSLPANILVGAGWYGHAVAGSPGYGTIGSVDELRLFSINTPGTFNITDLNPQAPPVIQYHAGDANEDGRVDINDLTIVLAHYNQTGMTWTQGEFTGDGTVDINDLTIVLANYGWTGTYSSVMKAVPEPASLVLLGAGALALLAFAKRRRAA